MPGLFGVKYKKNRACKEPLLLAKMMAESLRHKENYYYRIEDFENGAIGIVDVRPVEKDQFVNKSQSTNTIAIYGSLYDLIDLPSNIGNSLRGKLDGKAIDTLYATYGASVVGYINGDFCICINDEKKEQLTIGNDRFGFRHLYVYEDDEVIMFAPEIKAFLRYADLDKTLDEQGMADYFNYSYHLENRTFFRHVKLLPPGTILTCANGATKYDTYWSPRYETRLTRADLDDAVNEGYRLFLQSMERRVNGKQRFLVPLSGGLDSRLIASTAKLLGCDVTPASFGFRKSEDVRIAKKVSNALGLPTPKLVESRADYIWAYGSQVSHFGECNYASLGMTVLHAFAEQMGYGYDGLLNGIFGGHISFGSPYFKRQMNIENLAQDQLIDLISIGLEGNRFNKFLGKSATALLRELSQAYYKKSIEAEWEKTSRVSPLNAFRMDQLFIHNRIRRCMNAIDHNRYFYVDEFPFASYELFDFYHGLDQDLLLDHFLYKEIYKTKMLQMSEIPWQSTGVNLYAAPSFLRKAAKKYRNKLNWYIRRASRGRINPVSADRYEDLDAAYRKNIKVKKWINGIVLSDKHLSRGYFSREGLLNLLDWQERGGSAFFEISKIVMFELWHRKFIDNDSY